MVLYSSIFLGFFPSILFVVCKMAALLTFDVELQNKILYWHWVIKVFRSEHRYEQLFRMCVYVSIILFMLFVGVGWNNIQRFAAGISAIERNEWECAGSYTVSW